MAQAAKSGVIRNAWSSIPNYVLVFGSTWGSRVFTTVISLVSIRLMLNVMGIEHYAAYAVLSGIAGWFTLTDLGVGQSLQNYISESRALNRPYTKYILTAAMITLAVATAGVAAAILFGKRVASLLLGEFRFLTDSEKYVAFATIAGLAISATAGSLVFKIWYAEHKGYLANLVSAVGALVGLLGIYLVSWFSPENKLLWCLIAVNSPAAILSLASLLVRVRRPTTIAYEEAAGPGTALLKRSGKFWMFNLAAAMVVQIDYIVLSQFESSTQIVIYNIGAKIFAIAGFMFSAVHQAFWPVCAEASISGDWQQIRSFSKKYLLWGAVFLTGFTLSIVVLRSQITSLLSSRGEVKVPLMPVAFIVALGVLYLIRLWSDLFAVILQSMNDMKVLLICAGLQAVIGLLLQVALVPRFGIYGTVFALSLSWLLTVGWVLPIRVWQRQRERARYA